MITRVRFEAEASTVHELEEILYCASSSFVENASESIKRVLFGEDRQALAEAQVGEFVIERMAKKDDGAIFFKGRQTSHFAIPRTARTLKDRSDGSGPFHVLADGTIVDGEDV